MIFTPPQAARFLVFMGYGHAEVAATLVRRYECSKDDAAELVREATAHVRESERFNDSVLKTYDDAIAAEHREPNPTGGNA